MRGIDLIIFGADGGLGIELIKEAAARNKSIVAVTRNPQPQVLIDVLGDLNKKKQWKNVVLLTNCDLSNPEDVKELTYKEDIANSLFKSCVSTIGWTDVDGCFADPYKSFLCNTMANINIFSWCAKTKIPFYFVSTNDVFTKNEESPPYNIYTRPFPEGVYSKHKELMERMLREFSFDYNSPATCIRTSLLSTFKATGNTFLYNLISAIKMGKTVRAITDQLGNPLFVGTVAEEILNLTGGKYLIAAKTQNRVVHLAPEDWMSRYEVALCVKETIEELKPKLVHPDFNIAPITMKQAIKEKMFVDIRSQTPVLKPFPIRGYLMKEEIGKAVKAFFEGG